MDLRSSWGDLEDICSSSVNCDKAFSDYYEALDAYDDDADNAYYGVVSTPLKKSSLKTNYNLGTPVDFLEYTIVGFLDDNDERAVEVYKCKGTLWLKKVSGEYIIKKAKRSITLLDDYTKNIWDDNIVASITEQVTSFLGDDYDNEDQDDTSNDVQLTVSDCPNTTTNQKITVSGTVKADNDFNPKVYINDNPVTVNYDGKWSSEVSLKDGQNLLVIKAENSSGKTSTIYKSIKLTSDAPAILFYSCPSSSTNKIVTISGKVTDTNDTTPKLYINDEYINVSIYTGNWSKSVTLNEGSNTYIIKATNSLGKITTITRTIVFIPAGPNIQISSCPATSNNKIVTISGKVTDINDKNPILYINGEQVNVNSYLTTWSKDVTLQDGVNSFVIKAVDCYGKSSSVTKTIIFTTSAPNIIINNCPESSSFSKVTMSGKVTDVNDSSPKLYINDELISLSNNNWSKELTLKEGTNTVTIKAINSLGKTTTIIRTINFVVGAPKLVLLNFPDSSTVNSVTVSGKVSDDSDKNPKVYMNGELLPLNSSDNSWSKTLTLAEGQNTFEIKAINSYGKTTVLTRNIIYRNMPPTLQVLVCPETSAAGKVVISGTVSDLTDPNPTVFINNEAIAVTAGSWSKEVTLIAGINSFTIKAKDAGGKEVAITKSITYNPPATPTPTVSPTPTATPTPTAAPTATPVPNTAPTPTTAPTPSVSQ
jgi:Predicted solute binding protein